MPCRPQRARPTLARVRMRIDARGDEGMMSSARARARARAVWVQAATAAIRGGDRTGRARLSLSSGGGKARNGGRLWGAHEDEGSMSVPARSAGRAEYGRVWARGKRTHVARREQCGGPEL